MRALLALALAAWAAASAARAQPATSPDCAGAAVTRGGQAMLALADGGVALHEKMNVNFDGAGRAYHRDGFAAGALLHLCNAGKVHLPDGTSYQGSESDATCTGKFVRDVARIGAAGWSDGAVGAVHWYGIRGRDEAVVSGRRVTEVRPVEQPDGSGFYVSPTTLEDPAFAADDQRRYVDALTVPAAVVSGKSAIAQGTLGVAWRARGCSPGRACEPTPFIVGDRGPRIGEGSLALGRLINGLDLSTPITRANRFQGQVDGKDVLYVFFAGETLAPPYGAERVREHAQRAFAAWGGRARLEKCRAMAP